MLNKIIKIIKAKKMYQYLPIIRPIASAGVNLSNILKTKGKTIPNKITHAFMTGIISQPKNRLNITKGI